MPENQNRWAFYNNYINFPCTYIKINKVATQTLAVAFNRVFGKSISGMPTAIKKPFIFAFVRNPYDRAVSCWLNQIVAPTEFSKNLFKDGMHKSFWRYPGLNPGMSFPDFAKVIHDIHDGQSNPHFKSQSWFLLNGKGQLEPDYIGRFEMLQEDFNVVCNRVGVNSVALPHRNRTKKRGAWKKYYKPITRDLIYERYREDFELFGYERG